MRTRGPQLIQPYPPELAVNQIYKLGVEALGGNNTTTAGKALIAEDLKLLRRLQVAQAPATSTNWTKGKPSVDKTCTSYAPLAGFIASAVAAVAQLSDTPAFAALSRQQWLLLAS